jgi:hypothetical protein
VTRGSRCVDLAALDGGGVKERLPESVAVATGMRPIGVDTLAVERIVAETKPDGYGFRSLVHAVIQSDLFRNK